MIEGMQAFIGRKLKESAIQWKQPAQNGEYYIVTRPDYYSDAIHINMCIYFDENRIITDFWGDKCYSVYRGMFNRSSNVFDRKFTKRDIQYLRRFVKESLED